MKTELTGWLPGAVGRKVAEKRGQSHLREERERERKTSFKTEDTPRCLTISCQLSVDECFLLMMNRVRPLNRAPRNVMRYIRTRN